MQLINSDTLLRLIFHLIYLKEQMNGAFNWNLMNPLLNEEVNKLSTAFSSSLKTERKIWKAQAYFSEEEKRSINLISFPVGAYHKFIV